MGLISEKSYEDVLGDGLERALSGGATTLEEVVVALNQMNVRGPAGQIWNIDLISNELQRLGS